MTAPCLFLMTLIGFSGIMCGDGLLEENLQINLTQTVNATNGHTRYELTCAVTGVVGTGDFGWISVPCQSGAQTSTCTFTNDSALDNVRPTCTAVLRDSGQPILNRVLIDITYPQFHVSRSDVPGSNILQTGNVVTCTIPTNNTLVGNVDFACTDPQLDDQPDVINGTSVSSSVTVDAIHATDKDTTCLCDATLTFEGGYYHISSSKLFSIEYPAIVKNLTINNTDKEITVNGSDHAILNVVCEAFGRPKPEQLNMTTLYKDIIVINATETGKWTSQAAVTLSDIQCRDMGTYSCTAHNGVGHPDTRSIKLNVRCPPQKTFNKTLNMTVSGIVFTLEAFPAPDKFAFTYLGKDTRSNGTSVLSDFDSTCQQDRVKAYMVQGVIIPVNVPKILLGLYRVDVSNGIGSVEVAFQIRVEVVEGRTPMVWTVVGATAVFVVFVLFIIIIVLARRRCLTRRTPQARREEIVGSHEEVEFDPIRRQRQQSDQSHQDSDDNIPQPQLPPAGIPIFNARSRQMFEEEDHYMRISDSSSLSYEHAYDVTQRRGSRDEHCYTDLARP